MLRRAFVMLLLGLNAAHGAETDNRLANPSFAAGREPWYSLAGPTKPYWHDFSVATAPGEEGGHFARLDLTSREITGKTGIWGVLQEVSETASVPRYLRGRYFVETWQRGTAKQYIQAVFNVWLAEDRMGRTQGNVHGFVPMQLAFVLAGATEPPFRIGNRRFIFSGVREPPVGEWVDFEFDLREAFIREFGFLPGKFNGFRVLFEVRFDERAENEQGARAIVRFDDLYLGDERRGPKAPDSGDR